MFISACSRALSCVSESLQHTGQLMGGVGSRINSCWQWAQNTRIWTVAGNSYIHYIQPLNRGEKLKILGVFVVVIGLSLSTKYGLINRIIPRLNTCWQWALTTRLWSMGCKPFYDRYILPLNRSDKQIVLSTVVIAIIFPIFIRLFKSSYLPLSGIVSTLILYHITWQQIRRCVETPLNIAVADEIPALLDAVRATTQQNVLPQALDVFDAQLKLQQNSHLKKESDCLDQLKKAFTDAHGRQQLIELKLELSDYLTPIIAQAAGHLIEPLLAAFKVAVDALGTPTHSVPDYRRTYNGLLELLRTTNFTPTVQQQIVEIVRMKGEIDRVINQRSFVDCRTQLANFLVQLYQQLNPAAPPLPIL